MHRPSRLVIVLALAGALTLTISTGAVSWADADSLGDADIETEEELLLLPTSEYAYLDGGETVVDITGSNEALAASGLNPNARMTITDVAMVRYNGSEYATVYVTADSDAITVTNDGEPMDTANESVRLSPDDPTASLDLVIDTSNMSAESRQGTLTITASGSPPPDTSPAVSPANDDADDDSVEETDDMDNESDDTDDVSEPSDGTDDETGTIDETSDDTSDGTEDDSNDGPEPSDETDDGTTTDETAPTALIEEPAAISLSRLLGVVVTGAIALSLITLIRRVST